MKKEYVKPAIMVEFFQLDAAIASSCSANGLYPLNYSADTCTWEQELPGGYFGGNCTHDVKNPGSDSNDTICYHGPGIAVDAVFMNS